MAIKNCHGLTWPIKIQAHPTTQHKGNLTANCTFRLNQKGFTLIELMMTLVIGAMITAAAYATYTSQHKAYYAQDQVAEMQQNLRSAFYLIIEEVQMAGYDPLGKNAFGITSALPGRLQLTWDEDEDGVLDDNEKIDIGFTDDDDSDDDGIPDSKTNDIPDAVNLGTQTYYKNSDDNSLEGAGYQPIAENIQAIEFLYLDDKGLVLNSPDTNRSAIRSIQVKILARAERPDPNFINSKSYYPTPSDEEEKKGWGPYADHFRRRLLTTTIKCRNLGM